MTRDVVGAVDRAGEALEEPKADDQAADGAHGHGGQADHSKLLHGVLLSVPAGTVGDAGCEARSTS